MSRDISSYLRAIFLNQSHYLGDNTSLTYVKNGCRMFVDSLSVDIGSHLLTLGEWEPNYTSAFRRLIWKGAKFIDAGANHGWYTIVAAPIVQAEGAILAIEPNPRLSQLIGRSISINGFSGYATVLNVAISDMPGTLSFDIGAEGYSGGATTRRYNEGGEAPTIVKCDTLDNLAKKWLEGYADIIKIDIEGWEGVALRGATDHLRSSERLRIMAEWSPQMDDTEIGRGHLATELNNFGFQPYVILSDGSLLKANWESVVDLPNLCNLVIARKDDDLPHVKPS